MITPEKLARINALARKAKAPEGLTATEAAEQQALRREYIDAVKNSLRPQIEAIRFVEEDGSIVNPRTGAVEGIVVDGVAVEGIVVDLPGPAAHDADQGQV